MTKDPVTNLLAEQEISTKHRSRRGLYYRILSNPCISPKEDLKGICKAWLDLTGAVWVWLWLYHEANDYRPGFWEVTACSSNHDPEYYTPKSPVPTGNDRSVAEFCNLTQRPILVDNVRDWQREYQGRTFGVVCMEDLLILECSSFLCVPLLSPEAVTAESLAYGATFQKGLRAAICAHYYNEPHSDELQSEESLLLMGRLTAHALTNSYEADQHRILHKLNRLAEKYLTRRSRRPAEDRKNYLDEVIALLQGFLGVEYASLFYRSDNRDSVHCLATTGLWDSGGQRLAANMLMEASYKQSEGLTGTVFATGKPYYSSIGKPAERTKYKYRETPAEIEEAELPWIIYPIIAPSRQAEDNRKMILGVIRCVGNRSRLVRNQPRNFDPIQVQMLDFIVHQLAPTLETMAVNVEREKTIAVVKHDLFAPIRMIEDTLVDLGKSIESGSPLSPYTLPNLQVSALVAKNLVGTLDPHPMEIRSFNPQPTNLEGDIVARVRSMLSHFAKVESSMMISFEDIRESIPRLFLDRDLIERVLCNLIVNAIKYGKKGTTIRVSARQDSSGYHLDVMNYGIGVAAEEEKLIFKGTYRSIHARRYKQGLGMGLKIAKAAMERHGGRLSLTARIDPTVFTMTFPLKLSRNIPQ